MEEISTADYIRPAGVMKGKYFTYSLVKDIVLVTRLQ